MKYFPSWSIYNQQFHLIDIKNFLSEITNTNLKQIEKFRSLSEKNFLEVTYRYTQVTSGIMVSVEVIKDFKSNCLNY